MSDDAPTDVRPIDVRSKRGVTIAILAGVVVGAAHGIPRYGLFTFSNVAMIGLGIILTCGIYAIVVAVKPSTNGAPGDGKA